MLLTGGKGRKNESRPPGSHGKLDPGREHPLGTNVAHADATHGSVSHRDSVVPEPQRHLVRVAAKGEGKRDQENSEQASTYGHQFNPAKPEPHTNREHANRQAEPGRQAHPREHRGHGSQPRGDRGTGRRKEPRPGGGSGYGLRLA